MTTAEVGGWGDPGADPPHEWERTRTRLEEAECALAGLVSENNELRAIIRRVREYAQLQHDLAQDYRDHGGLYMGRTHDEIGTALERIIGDRP